MIQQHVASSKHKAGNKKLAKKEEGNQYCTSIKKNIMIMYIPPEKPYMIMLGYMYRNHIKKNGSSDQ